MSPDPVPADALQVETAEDAVAGYGFGRGIARHCFCRHCGICTFHETASEPGRRGGNPGCVEGVDPFALEVAFFDGLDRL